MSSSTTKFLNLIILLSGVVILVNASSDIDNLVDQFESNFGLTAQHLGLNPNGGQPGSIQDAELKMRSLYTAIENYLLEARQRAANDRSSVTSYTIKSLKLM